MDHKGLVIDIKDKDTVYVMTPDANFLEVKTNGQTFKIGDEILFYEIARDREKKHWAYSRSLRYAAGLAAALVFFITDPFSITDIDDAVKHFVRDKAYAATAHINHQIDEQINKPVARVLRAIHIIKEPANEPEPVNKTTVEPTEDSLKNPTKKLVKKPAQKPVQKPVMEPIETPVTEPVDQPVNEPVCQFVTKQVNGLTNELVIKPVENVVKETAIQPIIKPVDNLVKETAIQPIEKVKSLVKELVKEPAKDPVKEPDKDPVKKNKLEQESITTNTAKQTVPSESHEKRSEETKEQKGQRENSAQSKIVESIKDSLQLLSGKDDVPHHKTSASVLHSVDVNTLKPSLK